MYGRGNKALQGIYDSRDLWDYSKISVCWNTSGFQNEKTQVREAVENTWESYSNIDFIGWRDCQENEDIDIRITINDSQPGVTSGRFGKALQGLQQAMVLNFTYQNWSSNCINREEFCTQNIAVHEFGHALGLRHEQYREDTPQECIDELKKLGNYTKKLIGDTIVYVGSWDSNSTMNYCNNTWNNHGQLSVLDKLSVQEMYSNTPKRKSTDIGILPSNMACPDSTHEVPESMIVYMDNENTNSRSLVQGWTGGVKVYSSGNSIFYFCRVDGTKFKHLNTQEPYAVIKLGSECPNGSQSITKYFANESYSNSSFIINQSGNNKVIKMDTGIDNNKYTATRIDFCLFSDGLPTSSNFPSFNDVQEFKYGVFAGVNFSKGLDLGAILIDGEDNKSLRFRIPEPNNQDFRANIIIDEISLENSGHYFKDGSSTSDNVIFTRRVKSLNSSIEKEESSIIAGTRNDISDIVYSHDESDDELFIFRVK